MAGRIRSIKPEFVEDEKLGKMQPVTRLLFACLWLLADDYGNLRACPEWIHGQVFWGDPSTTVENVRESLATLARGSLLTEYTVREQAYYHVSNWHRHQKVDKPGKPRIPGPDDPESAVKSTYSRDTRESAEKVIETLAPDLRSPISDLRTGTTEQGGGPGEPAPLSLTASPAPTKRNGSKPTKIPDGWKPSDRQVEALAEKHGVKPERIRSEVSEFIWYWSDGGGAGKLKSSKGWQQTFGNRIDEQAKRGVLFAAPTPAREDVRSKLQRELEEMDQPYADS